MAQGQGGGDARPDAAIAKTAEVTSAREDASPLNEGSSVVRVAKSPAPDKRTRAAQQARKAITVVWYQLRCELGSRDFWVRVALIALQVSSIAVPLFKAGVTTGVLSLGFFMLTWFVRSWRDGRRPNLKTFERNAAERSATLYRVVTDLQRRDRLGPDEVQRYRCDVLRYIAHYVRDHRRDAGTPTIFANLLVVDGPDVVVIARDREHRVTRARYPKSFMLAGEAIASGQVQLTGDVRVDYPGTASGKPYTSILAIPVFYRGRTVGAVSVDSSTRYHFDLDWRELVDHLAPYVAMLGWTAVPPAIRLEESDSVESLAR